MNIIDKSSSTVILSDLKNGDVFLLWQDNSYFMKLNNGNYIHGDKLAVYAANLDNGTIIQLAADLYVTPVKCDAVIS